MPDVTMTVKDERAITVPAAGDHDVVTKFSAFLTGCVRDGYMLKETEPLQEDRGSQRDPYIVTTGVRFTFEKDPSFRPKPIYRNPPGIMPCQGAPRDGRGQPRG